MSDRWKVFWCEPTDRERRWLRRYTQSSIKSACEKTGSYCNAMYAMPEADILYTADGMIEGTREDARPPKEDPRWPTHCEACNREFALDDPYQLFGRQIYIRPDTGERFTLEDAPIGACWNAWIADRRVDYPTGCGYFLGDDRRSLVIKLPFNGQWMIDSRASNCTKPSDDTHHCWVRTGKPEDGTLHVDKNGNTCAAGAGSIQTDKWHGFLHNGYLHT